MVPMIIGDGSSPASLHHVATGDITTRLYLLEGPQNRTMAIEVSDYRGGIEMEELDAVVAEFMFGG